MKSEIKKIMSFIFSLCICTSLLSSVCVNSFAVAENVGDVVLYVSPDAADKGEGTTESPISLTGAKEMLKGLKNEKATATVYLLGGTYCFDDVLCFNSEDMANVTYKAYDKEKVVFSGAYEINGFKESEVNGVKVFTKKT